MLIKLNIVHGFNLLIFIVCHHPLNLFCLSKKLNKETTLRIVEMGYPGFDLH
jgi:hypothetical protein